MKSSYPTTVPGESTMSFINKLNLERPQRLKVTGFLQEIRGHQEQLKLVYRQEDYAHLSTDEKINAAKDLLKTNFPATSLLLKNVYEEQLTSEQKLECLHHLYIVFMAHGPLKEGLKYAEEHYAISKSMDSDPSATMTPSEMQSSQFQAACDVGNAHCLLGNLDKAKIFLDEAKDIATKMADQNKMTLATIYHGNWLLASGQLKIAMEEVYKPLLGVTNLSDHNRGLMLQGFGNACRSAADWGPAKDYLRESITIAESLNDSVAVADRYGDLGTVYRSEGRTADALENQKKHYQYAKIRGDRAGLSVACFNLGFTYFSSKPPHLSSAVIYHTIQLELSHSIGLPGMKSRALNCLGKVFTSLSNYDGAIQLFNECVDLHSQTGNIAGLGMAYGNLGTAYRAIGNYDDAVMFHEKYRDNAAERDDVGGVAIMQREIAWDYLFQQDYKMAEESVKEALVTLEQIRMKLGPEDTSRIANYEKNQAETYNLLLMVLVKQGKTKEALALSEKGRARALADIIHSKLEKTNNKGQGSNIDLVDEVISDSEDATNILKLVKKLNVTFLAYSIVTESSEQSKSIKWVYIWVVTMATDGKPTVHFAKQPVAKGEYDKSKMTVDDENVQSLCRSLGNLNVNSDGTKLRQGDATNGAQDEMGVCQPETPTKLTCQKEDILRDIGQRYHHNSQLTDLHTTDLNLKDKKIQQNQKSSDLSEDVQEQKDEDETKREKEEKEQVESFRAYYDLLIAPIEEFLPKQGNKDTVDAPRIVIIPQGFLFKIPFCALMDHNNTHLIQKYMLSFAPSIQVLQLTHHRLDNLRQHNKKAPPSVLAIGNPKMPHPIIHPLPAANREVQMVKNHFDIRSSNTAVDGDWTESVVVTGVDATVDFMKEHMGDHDVLHIATHAEQDEGLAERIQHNLDHTPRKPPSRGDFSMKGYLVLARSNVTCKGYLTAEEIKAQDLKAELAVLSCCHTGMGQVTGDGVLGLYRSFLAAGVAGVIITNWEIQDKATAKFMQHFYEAYKVHRDPAKALRSAMLKMLNDERHHSPGYWAAFAVIGASISIN